MATAISLPDDLFLKVSETARQEGFDGAEDFIACVIEEKLQALEEKRKVFEITERVRIGLERKGISEEMTIADFERFREKLSHERTEGNDRR